MQAGRRVAAVRTRLADVGLSAFVSNSPANVAYLTGFDGAFDDEPASAAVITADVLAIYTDARYLEVVGAAAEGTSWDVRLVKDGLWSAVVADFLDAGGDGRVGVEATLAVGTYRRIERDLADRVEALEGWVEQARRVKDTAEIERIARAQELTDAAFAYVLDMIGAGVSEKQVALDLEMFMRSQGSDGVAFNPIVASGPNSSKPHAMPTDRTIAPGDLVVLDFGARVDGYCADMTRTVAVGRASERQREVYEAVRAANEAGIAAVSEAHTGAEADAAAREVLTARGFGEAFTHGLGHGVGREVHELPTLSAKASDKLVAGEVVTVEPGAYVPGFGGVRIEDLVVVGAENCSVLTVSTKDLIEV